MPSREEDQFKSQIVFRGVTDCESTIRKLSTERLLYRAASRVTLHDISPVTSCSMTTVVPKTLKTYHATGISAEGKNQKYKSEVTRRLGRTVCRYKILGFSDRCLLSSPTFKQMHKYITQGYRRFRLIKSGAARLKRHLYFFCFTIPHCAVEARYYSA